MKKKDLESYIDFKNQLASVMSACITNTILPYIKVEQLFNSFLDAGGDASCVRPYLNILYLYDINGTKDVLIEPSLLIDIDSDEKELAWCLRLQHIDIDPNLQLILKVEK